MVAFGFGVISCINQHAVDLDRITDSKLIRSVFRINQKVDNTRLDVYLKGPFSEVTTAWTLTLYAIANNRTKVIRLLSKTQKKKKNF